MAKVDLSDTELKLILGCLDVLTYKLKLAADVVPIVIKLQSAIAEPDLKTPNIVSEETKTLYVSKGMDMKVK